MRRGDIWWAGLPEPVGAEPGYKRPVLIIQADSFNKSRIDTVVVVALTSNMKLAGKPGNVVLGIAKTNLPVPSVANVTQLATVDKDNLLEPVGTLDRRVMRLVDDGLRLVMALQ